MGGVGKTQLALEYAWKHLVRYQAVLWVKADGPEALDEGLSALVYLLGLPVANENDQTIRTNAVSRWLREHQRWLVVADNADTEATAKAVRDRFSAHSPGSCCESARGSLPMRSRAVFSPRKGTFFRKRYRTISVANHRLERAP